MTKKRFLEKLILNKLILWLACCTLLGLFLPMSASAAAIPVGVAYRGHIQDLGDYPADGNWVDSPKIIGTEGQSKRIEGFEIKLTGAIPTDLQNGLELRYNVHVQNKGWLYDENDSTNWPKDGDYAGTRGESLRIEAVKIVLTDADGKAVSSYSVQYRGHVQNVGNLPTDESQWLADSDQLGTVGSSLRLEALLVKVVQKETDLAAYTALVTQIEKLKAGDFTAQSWGRLQTALKEHLVTADQSQTAVDAAVKAIQLAYDGLEKKAAPTVYDKAGTFGPATGTQTIAGDVTVNADGVILQNLKIEGDLTIAEAVGNGTVTLNNVTVVGDTFVRGGGKNSIHINGGQYSRIVMEKTASGAVRIVATGVDGLDVVISEDAAGETIILEGAFDSVVVNAPNMTVTTQGNTTTIGKMTVGAAGAGSTVTFNSGTTVSDLVLDGKASVKGQGTVVKAEVKADGVVFDKKPGSYTVEPGVVVPPVFPTPDNGGGSGGGYTPPAPVAVTEVSLNQQNLNLVYNATETLVATVLPANAANKAVSFTSSNLAVATVDSTTGLITTIGAGSATIMVITTDGGLTASCLVTVTLPALPTEIKGIPIPFAGDHPVMTITETDQYSGTITWKEASSNLTADSVFDGSKWHDIVITLTLKEPYNTDPISTNYFTVPGATARNNSKSLKIYATFYPFDQYRVDETGVISAYSGPGGALALPTSQQSVDIIEIGTNAFQNRKVTEISILDVITTIGSGAFAENNLTKITLGANVTIADDTAMGVNGASFKTFYETESGGVSKRKGNYYYLNSAWYYSGNQLGQLWFNETGQLTAYVGTDKNLVIPEGTSITAIASQALAGRGLNSLGLPAAVQTIGDGAFKGNTLDDISIGDGVTVGADNALGNNTASFLTAYTAHGGGNYHCYFDLDGHPSWSFSDVVVNGIAFNKASRTINSYNGAGGNLLIPASFDGVAAKTILENSFSDMKLTGLTFESPSEVETIGAGAFYLNNIPDLVLPASLKSIGGSAFQSCWINSVKLSDGLKTIDVAAFLNNQLTTITIPASVTSIGQQAFVANKLTEVVIEGTDGAALTIGPMAFQSLNAESNLITRITIPANVKITDDAAMGKYGAAFKAFYENAAGNNKAGGSFSYDVDLSVWTKN